MKTKWLLLVIILLIFILPEPVLSEFVIGNNGLEKFEDFRKKYCDVYIDFENIPTGLHKRLAQFPVTLRTTFFRWPYPSGFGPAPAETPVAVLPYDFVNSPPNHRLMGVTNALKPDGQSKYEIVFDNLQKRVGLLRMWNDYAFTRFLGENDKLITTHFNKSNQEFIGYICENDIPCIKRVEFDGIPSDPDSEYNKVYQVGEVDNLYFSEPSLKLGLKATPSSITAGEDISIQATVKSLVPYDIDDIEVKVDYTYSISEEEKTAEISFGKYKIPSLKTVPFEAVINTKDWSSQDLRINAILYSPLGYEIAKVTNIIDVRGTEIDSQIRNSIIHSIIILLHNVRGNPLPK